MASPRIGADPGDHTGFTPRVSQKNEVESPKSPSSASSTATSSPPLPEKEQKIWPNPLEIPAEIVSSPLPFLPSPFPPLSRFRINDVIIISQFMINLRLAIVTEILIFLFLFILLIFL